MSPHCDLDLEDSNNNNKKEEKICMTLWLMMLYYHTNFGKKPTSSLEDTTEIVIF